MVPVGSSAVSGTTFCCLIAATGAGWETSGAGRRCQAFDAPVSNCSIGGDNKRDCSAGRRWALTRIPG